MKIEKAVNIAIIVVALVVTLQAIRTWVIAAAPSLSAPVSPSSGIKAGDKSPGNHVYRRDTKKDLSYIALAISPECHFCEESIPFYRRLKTTGAPVQALMPDRNAGIQHLAEAGLETFFVTPVNMRNAHIGGTPTIMAVNREGIVTAVWRGKLTSAQEVEVLEAAKQLVKGNP